jgi:hypothetical protein
VLQYQTKPEFRAYSHEGMESRSLYQCTLQLRGDRHTQHEEDLFYSIMGPTGRGRMISRLNFDISEFG